MNSLIYLNYSSTALSDTIIIPTFYLWKPKRRQKWFAKVTLLVNTALEGLDTRLDAIDGGSTLTGESTLAARVSSLENEPKSATVIIDADCITYDS